MPVTLVQRDANVNTYNNIRASGSITERSCDRMNRILLVVRSMTNKIIELSRGVVTAPAYGESNRWSGVDQVNVLKVTADTCANVETRRCCEGVFGRLLMPALAGFLAMWVAMA